jgi:hypothetical protein
MYLYDVRRELMETIQLVKFVHVQLDEKSDTGIDVYEVGKVLRAMVNEVGRIIRAAESKVPNQRNIRPGADLALKAQLAKARWTELSEAEKRQREQSHK